ESRAIVRPGSPPALSVAAASRYDDSVAHSKPAAAGNARRARDLEYATVPGRRPVSGARLAPSHDTAPTAKIRAQNLLPSNPPRLWSARDSAKFSSRKGFVCICQQTGAFLQENAIGLRSVSRTGMRPGFFSK